MICLADKKMPTRACWTATYPIPEDERGPNQSPIINIDFEMTAK